MNHEEAAAGVDRVFPSRDTELTPEDRNYHADGHGGMGEVGPENCRVCALQQRASASEPGPRREAMPLEMQAKIAEVIDYLASVAELHENQPYQLSTRFYLEGGEVVVYQQSLQPVEACGQAH